MTKLLFVSAALVAAAVTQSQTAMARETHEHRAPAQGTSDCVRAPAVGAFATDPYKEPPCMPRK
jgi:hypothetical protein